MGKFDHLVGSVLDSSTFSRDSDRALLYAVGVGAGLCAPLEELQFTTENTRGVTQQVIPSFLTQMAGNGDWLKELGVPPRDWDGFPIGLVHGDQGVSLARPIPPAGTVHLEQVLVGIFDKGTGALCVTETRITFADTGEELGTTRTGLFVRGQGGFGGPRRPADEKLWVRPDRAPDLTVSLPIPQGQALIFRLNGDRNPHGTDPAIALEDGFDRPVFFGLGTYGFVCRALLKGLCDGDVTRFGSMHGRFSQPVHPGEMLDTHIWHTDDGAVFETWVPGKRLVIDRGRFGYAR